MTSRAQDQRQLQKAMRRADERSYCNRPRPTGDGTWRNCHERSCGYCGQLDKGDERRVARSGILDKNERPLPDVQIWFVTLTAPSFGRVHYAPDENRTICLCGSTHDPDDDIVGYPTARYDYEGALLWNAAASGLWKDLTRRIREEIGEISFWRSAELQARGSVHYHCLLRFPSDALVTEDRLAGLVRAASARNLRGEKVRWGGQCDMALLDAESAAHKVNYALKAAEYSLKDYVKADGVRTKKMLRRLASTARRFQCNEWCLPCYGVIENCKPWARGERASRGCVGLKGGCPGCKEVIHRNLFGTPMRVSRSRGANRWSKEDLSKRKLQEHRRDVALAAVEAEKVEAEAAGELKRWEEERQRKLDRMHARHEQREHDRLEKSYASDRKMREARIWDKNL